MIPHDFTDAIFRSLKVEEVGPYVYRVSSMKKNVVFSAEDVSYQSVGNSRFDLAATRLLCPKCNETDKV